MLIVHSNRLQIYGDIGISVITPDCGSGKTGSIPVPRSLKLGKTYNKMDQVNKNWYDRSYKWMLILPVILLIFSLVYLFGFYSKNGDMIYNSRSICFMVIFKVK